MGEILEHCKLVGEGNHCQLGVRVVLPSQESQHLLLHINLVLRRSVKTVEQQNSGGAVLRIRLRHHWTIGCYMGGEDWRRCWLRRLGNPFGERCDPLTNAVFGYREVIRLQTSNWIVPVVEDDGIHQHYVRGDAKTNFRIARRRRRLLRADKGTGQNRQHRNLDESLHSVMSLNYCDDYCETGGFGLSFWYISMAWSASFARPSRR